MGVEPETIFWGVLAFMWVEFVWEALLSARQRKIYKVQKNPMTILQLIKGGNFFSISFFLKY